MADLSKATRLQVPGLLGHDERTSENHTNEKIDPTRTWMNYNFISEVSLERYQRRMSEVYCLNRKNVNTLAMVSVTLPKEVKPEDQDRFFKVVFEHFKNQFGEQNVVSAFVHLDETTPHIHIKAIPVYLNEKNKQEQVSFDEVCPRNFYRRFHKDLSEVVEKELGYPTGILNGATAEGNKTVNQLKHETEMAKLQEAKKTLLAKVDVIQNEVRQLERQVAEATNKKTVLESKWNDFKFFNSDLSEINLAFETIINGGQRWLLHLLSDMASAFNDAHEKSGDVWASLVSTYNHFTTQKRFAKALGNAQEEARARAEGYERERER